MYIMYKIYFFPDTPCIQCKHLICESITFSNYGPHSCTCTLTWFWCSVTLREAFVGRINSSSRFPPTNIMQEYSDIIFFSNINYYETIFDSAIGILCLLHVLIKPENHCKIKVPGNLMFLFLKHAHVHGNLSFLPNRKTGNERLFSLPKHGK